mgnify:CR=1 FL=1
MRAPGGAGLHATICRRPRCRGFRRAGEPFECLARRVEVVRAILRALGAHARVDGGFGIRGKRAEAQAAVEAELADLKLYQFLACPFCVKVRRQMNRLDLPIEQRDTKRNEAWAEELLREGGSPKVPCLRIEEEGSVRWLYESGAINEYLEARFA